MIALLPEHPEWGWNSLVEEAAGDGVLFSLTAGIAWIFCRFELTGLKRTVWEAETDSPGIVKGSGPSSSPGLNSSTCYKEHIRVTNKCFPFQLFLYHLWFSLSNKYISITVNYGYTKNSDSITVLSQF